ncbi:MAG TPA: cytochrome c family protein [Methylococcus sp.]|nr:cytochrome c family protein [Methylococcus sp.]
MDRIRNLLRSFVWLALLEATVPGLAVELPAPDELGGQIGVTEQSVEVVEPHESDLQHETRVRYRAYPIESILDRFFGEYWKTPQTEVVFFARDGYRASIPSDKFRRDRAWLAFARSDGRPFVVDNPRQHENNVPLGPYYLIWDDIANPAARATSGYGWVYQTVRIELGSPADYQALQPPTTSPGAQEGLEHFRAHCLGCHQLNGLGGEKFPGDIRERSCRWSDAALKTWITEPEKVRPHTTMPPLDVLLAETERSRIAEKIVAYLRAMEAGIVCPR